MNLTVILVRDGKEKQEDLGGWFYFSSHIPKRILKNPRDTDRKNEDIYLFDVYERCEDGKYHYTGEEESFQYTGR